jgi:hypothetical protein
MDSDKVLMCQGSLPERRNDSLLQLIIPQLRILQDFWAGPRCIREERRSGKTAAAGGWWPQAGRIFRPFPEFPQYNRQASALTLSPFVITAITITLPGFQLLYIAEQLIIAPPFCGNDHHGHLIVNQRNGAMLHFGCRIALGMYVGYLLQLQGPFQRKREVISPAQVQEVADILEYRGDFLYDCYAFQCFFHFFRNMLQFIQKLKKPGPLEMLPFLWAMDRAIRESTVTCAVKALVEATPISGPAWV